MATRTRAPRPAATKAPVVPTSPLAGLLAQYVQPVQQVVPEYGIACVTLSRNMPRKFSEKMNSYYCLGTIETAEDIKLSTANGPRSVDNAKLSGWETQLLFGEDLEAQISDAFESNGGTRLTFAFILNQDAQINELNDRVDGVDQFDDDGNPIMKRQIWLYINTFVGNPQVASIPTLELPEEDAALDSWLSLEQQNNKARQARGLSQWRMKRASTSADAGTAAGSSLED